MIKAFHSGILQSPHAFFTRVGGVSKGIFKGLNCSKHKGDDDKNVDQNRNLCLNYLKERFALDQTPRLIFGNQAHAHKTIYIPEDFMPSGPLPIDADLDGYVTKNKNILLTVYTADCCPILFEEPEAKIIGAAHAGWKGSTLGIIENTINLMLENGAERKKIKAAIGPCIKQASYEVKNDFIVQAQKNTSSDISPYILEKSEKFFFDLTKYIVERLKSNNIESMALIPMDTYSNPDLFFSCRRSTHMNEGTYGTQISCIGISE